VRKSFTIIEIMIVLSLILIGTYLCWPVFDRTVKYYKLRSVAVDTIDKLKQYRFEAMRSDGDIVKLDTDDLAIQDYDVISSRKTVYFYPDGRTDDLIIEIKNNHDIVRIRLRGLLGTIQLEDNLKPNSGILNRNK
jgi:Tfp pilus assembly protein FimT